MPSRLTSTADATKKGAIVLGISIIAFFVLRYTFKAAYTLCCTKPTPTPAPYINTVFGPLPSLLLPENTTTTANKKFNLETIDGMLPESTVSARIYEITKKNPELNYQENSENLASTIGFSNTKPERINDRTFLFQEQDDPNKKAEIDFIYNNVMFKYDNLPAYVSLIQGATPTLDQAKSSGTSLLYKIRPELRYEKNLLVDSRNPPIGAYSYFNPTSQQTTTVSSQQQANITHINIPRTPINGVSIISPYTTKNLIYFVFTGIPTSATSRNFRERLIEFGITFWSINQSSGIPAVYPIKSPIEAWEILNNGNAIVLNPPDNDIEYNIRSVYLAYYEPPIYQPYLQPVWVFEGDKPNDSNFLFRAIVPAVQTEYIQP